MRGRSPQKPRVKTLVILVLERFLNEKIPNKNNYKTSIKKKFKNYNSLPVFFCIGDHGIISRGKKALKDKITSRTP